MGNKVIYLIIFSVVILSSCREHPSKTPPVAHKFNLGDIVEHKVYGFSGQVISNGSQHWEYKHKWVGRCVVHLFPPLSPEAIEYIKAHDGGLRHPVEKHQIKRIAVRECEFEAKPCKAIRSGNERKTNHIYRRIG